MQRFRSFFAVLVFCCTASFATGQQQSLKAYIAPAQTVVRNDETFPVNVVVRNTGLKEQLLTVYECSYPDQWKPDNPAVHVRVVSCLQNSSYERQLKPGETYERTVSLRIHLSPGQIAPEKVTFRLGYGKGPYFGTRDFAPKIPLFWSNAITVTVTR